MHCNAAAKQTAAIERPDPGGPVISHACVIAWAAAPDAAPSRTAPPRAASAASTNSDSTPLWPTNRLKTPDIACQA